MVIQADSLEGICLLECVLFCRVHCGLIILLGPGLVDSKGRDRGREQDNRDLLKFWIWLWDRWKQMNKQS